MRAVTILVYLVCVAGFVTVEVMGYRRPDRFVAVGSLLDDVIDSRGVRLTVALFWWWLGWHFLLGV